MHEPHSSGVRRITHFERILQQKLQGFDIMFTKYVIIIL